MPVVPFNNRPGTQGPARPQVDDPWLLMAAATMDSEGRLMESESAMGSKSKSPPPTPIEGTS